MVSPIYTKDQRASLIRDRAVHGALSRIAQELADINKGPSIGIPRWLQEDLERLHKVATDALDESRNTEAA